VEKSTLARRFDSPLKACEICGLAAQADRWKGFQFLIGEWTGGGGGSSTGQGSATFSFHLDVDGKVLMRRNHAEYPAVKDNPRCAMTI
jgi:hypothetical protein